MPFEQEKYAQCCMDCCAQSFKTRGESTRQMDAYTVLLRNNFSPSDCKLGLRLISRRRRENGLGRLKQLCSGSMLIDHRMMALQVPLHLQFSQHWPSTGCHSPRPSLTILREVQGLTPMSDSRSSTTPTTPPTSITIRSKLADTGLQKGAKLYSFAIYGRKCHEA